MANIHQTALVADSAKIADDVTIGAFCIIEEDVTIGNGCKICDRSTVKRYTKMGQNNVVHQNVIIGGDPQDLNFNSEMISYTEIGDNNTFREGFTVHRATKEGEATVIGNNNFFMVNTHVAHDCVVKNNNILVNNAVIAGHVVLEGNCLLSGLVAVHQFCRIGRFSVISGVSATSLDIPPFCIADGRNGSIRGINLVGLKRSGVPTETIRALKNVYKIFYRSDLNAKNSLLRIEEEYSQYPEVMEFVEFCRNSKRGVNQGRMMKR
ncbi:acyl-ACP--UDP-N-acetylglucosamine O-acyltransferase [Lentisphaerota bacterium WC36G]|nr:acyl-ACP--UDP-N-acetylglucosamine O-acyltransferase [Lentisphaerae bacterium WC36]